MQLLRRVWYMYLADNTHIHIVYNLYNLSATHALCLGAHMQWMCPLHQLVQLQEFAYSNSMCTKDLGTLPQLPESVTCNSSP